MAEMPTCGRCKQDLDDLDDHTFYAWDITHECRHTVTYRAICDRHAFSTPQVGANTSTFLARIAGDPCPWCGGEAYKDIDSQPPPHEADALRLEGDERIAHLLAFRSES
jgi:hypothetical protein